MRDSRAVVFDLEYTAWEGAMARRWLAPGEYREVVQIGAVMVEAQGFAPLAEFQLLVRPRLNPQLSAYFENLTGIANEAVKRHGVDFAAAYARFVAFAEGAPLIAYGRDDLVLTGNLRLYGIADAPPLPRHVNCGPWLGANGIDIRGAHACDVARLCGAPFEGRAHDALEDARSVALGIAALLARGAPHPLEEEP